MDAPEVEEVRVDRKLVTILEAAEVLALSRTVVYPLVMSGAIRSFQIGRARRIPVEALDEFIAKKEAETVPTGSAPIGSRMSASRLERRLTQFEP